MIEVRGVRSPAYTDQIDFPITRCSPKKPVGEKDLHRPGEKEKPVKGKEGTGVQLRFPGL